MAKQKPSSGKKGAFAGIAVCVCLAIMGVAVLPTTLIVAVGMIPTAVAFFADSSRERSLGMTVLMLNAAGVLPLLLKLWKVGHTTPEALTILTDPFMLLFVLVPSGCGWLLYQFTPYLVIGLMKRKAEARIRTLEKYQAELVEQWGPSVGGAVLEATKTEALPAPDKASTAQ